MSFGIIPLSPDDKPDGFVLLSMYEKLESENAKLREDMEAAKHDLSLFSGELVASKAENAKLRELVSVMAYCIQGWRDCDGCRVNGGAGIITERAGCYVLLDRLRELGVEVV